MWLAYDCDERLAVSFDNRPEAAVHLRLRPDTGTVQGGSISPLLANLYLHYVFDLWTQRRSGRRRAAT